MNTDEKTKECYDFLNEYYKFMNLISSIKEQDYDIEIIKEDFDDETVLLRIETRNAPISKTNCSLFHSFGKVFSKKQAALVECLMIEGFTNDRKECKGYLDLEKSMLILSKDKFRLITHFNSKDENEVEVAFYYATLSEFEDPVYKIQ